MNEEKYRELQRNWRRRAVRFGLDQDGDDYHHDELVRLLESGRSLDEDLPLLYTRFARRAERGLHTTKRRVESEVAAGEFVPKVAPSAEDEAMSGMVWEFVERVVARILDRVRRADVRAVLRTMYLTPMTFSEAVLRLGVAKEVRDPAYVRMATAVSRALAKLPEDEREVLDVWADVNGLQSTRQTPEDGSRLLVGLLTKEGLV